MTNSPIKEVITIHCKQELAHKKVINSLHKRAAGSHRIRGGKLSNSNSLESTPHGSIHPCGIPKSGSGVVKHVIMAIYHHYTNTLAILIIMRSSIFI